MRPGVTEHGNGPTGFSCRTEGGKYGNQAGNTAIVESPRCGTFNKEIFRGGENLKMGREGPWGERFPETFPQSEMKLIF